MPVVCTLLEGDANDYVGKGMAGGRISIFPPKVRRSRLKILPSLETPVCTVRLAVSYLLPELRVSVLQYVTLVHLLLLKVRAITAVNI